MKTTGIVLLLCWPALVILGALSPLFVSKSYTATSFIERGTVSNEDLNHAFEQVAPKGEDVTIEEVKNTDLLVITARDRKSQSAVDRANSVATQLNEKLEKLEKQPSQLPRVHIPETSALPPPRPMVWANILAGFVLGLFPAVLGLVLFVLAGHRDRAVTPAAQVA